MSARPPARPPHVRGPLTYAEHRALRSFCLRPFGMESLGAFGLSQARTISDLRGAFGITLPGHVRREWRHRAMMLAIDLEVFASPWVPAMATPENRAHQADRVASSMRAFAKHHDAQIVPIFESLPPLYWPDFDDPQSADADGNVLIFPRPPRGRDDDDDGSPPLGAA